MLSRYWLNLALLLIVVALAALSFFAVPGKPPAAGFQMLELLDQPPHSILIERRAQQTVSLSKPADVWLLNGPFAGDADQAKVSELLRFLDASSDTVLLAQPEELHRFELTRPRVRLTINDTEFWFGATQPLNGRRYVLQGDKIYLLRDTAYYHLIAEPAGYASRALLPSHLHITALIHENRQVAVADPRLLESWRSATAERAQTLSNPSGEALHVEFSNGPRITFYLRATDDALILGRADLGIEYVFPAAARAQLLGTDS